MRNIVLSLLLGSAFMWAHAAPVPGVNQDPYPGESRPKPYEMAGRTDDYPPLATFADCSEWNIEGINAEAELLRSADRKLFRESSGKIRFRATGANAEVLLRPQQPIPIPDPWDSVGVWNHGNHWVWMPAGPEMPWPVMTVLLLGADGKEYEIDGFSPLFYDYWFWQRRKVNAAIPRPARFAGFRFRNFSNQKPDTIFVDSINFYQASTQPLTFEAWPENLPFPLRNETIQPDLLTDAWRNEVVHTDDRNTEFRYRGADGELTYRWDRNQPFFDGLEVNCGGRTLRPMAEAGAELAQGGNAEVTLHSTRATPEGVEAVYDLRTAGTTTRLTCSVQIRGKSLIIDFHENGDGGRIARLLVGRAENTGDAKLFRLPFLTYGSVESDPRMLLANGMYVFSQFDWYVSDASELTGGEEKGPDFARFNGAAVYIPKTDGTRNRLRERLFLNVSTEPWEVFPTVDNPASPYREEQADRLWRVAGCHSPEQLALNTRLRQLGMDKVTIRYHEDDWRDGGESYTFRVNAAPGRGGDEALRQFVHDVQALGWKIGLYTNYTDLTPVNPYWHEDRVMQHSDGNWRDSWTRCYAPKPMWAVEMQAKLAPQIQRKFGEDHSYCDVHTAVTPFSRVDYDARVPGAGTFRRTFECFGRLLFNEKFAHKGPVYSEGYNHWWYAGLVDGNYGQQISHDKTAEPWLPDFHLRKLHPLEMDAAMGALGMFQGAPPWNIPRFIACSLAYGNIGFLEGDQTTDTQMMELYYLMQPIQKQYVMIPVTGIFYERDGVEYPTREALANDAWLHGRLRVVYANGFEIRVNRGETPWNELPQWGWTAGYPDRTGPYSTRRTIGDATVAVASGHDSHYFSSDRDARFGGMAGSGAAVLKREADGWELIPAREYHSFAFAPELIDAAGRTVQAIALDEKGNERKRITLPLNDGLLTAPVPDAEVFKYRLLAE